MESEDILTPKQLAERLQVGVNWVYEKSRGRGQHNGADSDEGDQDSELIVISVPGLM